MSDFEKEKKVYYDWEHKMNKTGIVFGNIIEEESNSYEAGFTSMGFYGGYHSRDEEIARLKSERDMYRNAEIEWEKLMMELLGEDGPKSVREAIEKQREAIKKLNDKIKKLEEENTILRAEIERKDDAIVKSKFEIEKQRTWNGQNWKQNHISDAIANKIHKFLEQSLQNKEESYET